MKSWISPEGTVCPHRRLPRKGMTRKPFDVTDKTRLPISLCHWGAFYGRVENGRFVEAIPIGGADPEMIRAWPELVHGASRIDQPYVRRGWLEGGAGASRKRGQEEMVPVTWDEALDRVSGEIARMHRDHGPGSILGGSYGWSSAGRLHHARSQTRRFLAAAGGFTDQISNYSWGAAAAILPHVLGSTASVAHAATSWSSVAEHADTVVAFGGLNPKNWRVTSGGAVEHTMAEKLARAKARGCRFIVISPLASDVPEGLEADLIQARPGSDTAIMLALAHEAWICGRADQGFLDRYTVGAERLVSYLTGQSDGIPKTLNWAARQSGVTVDELRGLWNKIGEGQVMLCASWSLQRAENGEQSYWALIALAAMLGQIGLPGGGFGFGYGSMGSVGADARRGYVPAMPALHNAGPAIPAAAVADALLFPGKTLEFNGQTLTLPDIRMVYWAGGNPFHHAQDLGKLEQGWARAETVVVHEPWWTATALRADIVLPATTSAERNDIGGTSRDPHVVFMPRLIEPQGQARSDREIFAALADRLGCRELFDSVPGALGLLHVGSGKQETSEQEWLEQLWMSVVEKGRSEGVDVPDLASLRKMGIWRVPEPDSPEVMLDTFRADPEKHPLPTPSGKIELFSRVIAGFAYDGEPGHPVFREPREWLGNAAEDECHLLTHQPERQLHSQLWQTSAGMHGAPAPVHIHPEDAAARGISDGMIVRVYNERGACKATAHVDTGVRRSVLVMPTGAWFQPDAQTGLEQNGNPNVLTADRRSSPLGQASAALSALARIEPFTD